MDNVVKLSYISGYQFMAVFDRSILDIRMTKVKHIFAMENRWVGNTGVFFLSKGIYVQVIKIRAYNTFNKK